MADGWVKYMLWHDSVVDQRYRLSTLTFCFLIIYDSYILTYARYYIPLNIPGKPEFSSMTYTYVISKNI